MPNNSSRNKQPTSWRDVIPVHPAADMLPEMTADEKKVLEEDIKKNGLRVPVVVWKPQKDSPAQLLDGRNRLDAIQAAGITIYVEEGDEQHITLYRRDAEDKWWRISTQANGGAEIGFDPYAFVISANIHRRHLTAEQKRELIAAVLKAQPEKSNRQVAKAVGVSHPHVAAVRAKLEKSGDVETVTTSIDTKGRKQKAHKPVADKPHDSADDAGGRAEPVREPRFDEFKNSKGKIKSSCDFNPEDPDDVAEPGDSDEVIRHRIFMHHASEALRHARAIASLRQKAAPQEITDDIIEAASQAAKAWSKLMQALDPVRDADATMQEATT
ncbi:ParB N-terminal domain-containing protein [Bradyrhizobium barranii subsp. apii]|uniref:ParB N-terminal domain-containing protein n=1 Tax=Bradyrhizobium barranii subsp. apii TaxID=2819348 RepID=A0A8T5V2G4_9BRAD|nr:ParB N-terminal domain-containing protein [Bradyrhizobium barranii]UPT87966.1 ParB N-terminal domain-containing protein [Bradyrhizobium barranii subsp. apii]